MELPVPTPARHARIESRFHHSPTAAVLVDTETGRQELLVRIEPATGALTATLCGADIEAMGGGPVVIATLSAGAITTAATTVPMNGYDTAADRCRRLEATISLTWTIDETTSNSPMVTGSALITDLDQGRVGQFRAVANHPFNRVQSILDLRGPIDQRVDDGRPVMARELLAA